MAELENPQVPGLGGGLPAEGAAGDGHYRRSARYRRFIAGDRFTVADITGLVALDFAKPARIAIPPELAHLNRWRETLAARPSAAA
jgi:glutathione S-transferase